MMQTIEALIDEKGKVHLLEEYSLIKAQRVLIIILPNQTNEPKTLADITNLGEIIDDDFESARQEFAQSFLQSIEKTGKELESN